MVLPQQVLEQGRYYALYYRQMPTLDASGHISLGVGLPLTGGGAPSDAVLMGVVFPRRLEQPVLVEAQRSKAQADVKQNIGPSMIEVNETLAPVTAVAKVEEAAEEKKDK